MNDRLQELAYRADLVIKKSNGNDFRFGAMDPKLEKFAELIVQECAEVSKNYAGGSMPLSIALAIKEHFGVER